MDKNNGSIAYQNELTLTAGQTLDLSTIILSSELGYTYPQTGAFSPADSNVLIWFCWSNGNWDLGAHKDSNTVTFAVYSKMQPRFCLKSMMQQQEQMLYMIIGWKKVLIIFGEQNKQCSRTYTLCSVFGDQTDI